MLDSYFAYKGEDGKVVAARKWVPGKKAEVTHPVRAIVQIVHGMAEHIGRYHHFAKKLAEDARILTAGNDLRGHGQTAGSLDQVGRVTEEWEVMLKDVQLLAARLRREYPRRPLIMFGHSFGSIVVQALLPQMSEQIDGIILSGIPATSEWERKLGEWIVHLQMPLMGRAAKARLLTKLTFLGHNRGFYPRTTSYDWLSRDRSQVAAYVQDPYCGQACSLQFYRNLFVGLNAVSRLPHHKIRYDLPVLLLAGDQDRAGKGRTGTESAKQALENAGLTDVTSIIYEGGRHEMLNEVNRLDVYEDILHWIELRVL